MNADWTEQGYETLADETWTGGQGEVTEAEAEWDSPFATAEAEQEGAYEYGQEALADGGETEAMWEATGFESENEVLRTRAQLPPHCNDTTFTGKPWPFPGKPTNSQGKATPFSVVPRAEVIEFQLSDFDVDRHELKPEHKKALADLAKHLLAGIRGGRYGTDPIRVFCYGEASSTAGHVHNLELSNNRAFNTLNQARCAIDAAGITAQVIFGFYATGEVHARIEGPDQTENAGFRGVVVRAFAPLKNCDCKHPPGPGPRPPYPRPPGPGPRPPQQTGTSAICVSVPKVLPRVTTKLPPDLIPLGPLVPGLRLPFAIVTKGQATVRVAERRTRQSATYGFQGWGLEVALPSGRTRVSLQADLRASLDVLLSASASLGAKLRLGPLGLALRIDVSAFARLVAKLCAALKVRLDVDLARPNIPELAQCRTIEARNARGPGAFPFGALAGPALLVVPGRGFGPGIVHFAGSGVAGLGLASNPVPVPADKSTIKTLLALGGNLALASGGAREAEYEMPEAEWPEAFAEMESELMPFA